MSEQKKSFMAELDLWTETNVLSPLHDAITEGDIDVWEAACQKVKHAIREKVLESYRNGQNKPTSAKPVEKGARQWK